MTDLVRFLEFIEKAELDCPVEEVPFIKSTLPPGIYDATTVPDEPPLDPANPPGIGWSTHVDFCGMLSIRFSADGHLQSISRISGGGP
jgi:hypothetical protein